MDMLVTRMIHILGVTELDCSRYYHTTQDDMQLNTCEVFISGISHLMFLYHSRPWVITTMENKITDKWQNTVFL